MAFGFERRGKESLRVHDVSKLEQDRIAIRMLSGNVAAI